MNLIESLAAGIRGAENGYAQIFVRGTSTRADWYEDFEGTVVNSSGANVALDGNGRAIVYANQLVTVVAYTSGGVQVTSFTAGSSAPLVEYQGQSFVGANYSTSAQGAGSGFQVSLQTILDRLYTSFGSTNWNVLVGGVATTVQNALGRISGIFYNVKSPDFGAVGDGVVDDTTAIQAAVDAADAAGGGIVFFPAGTYSTTSTIVVPLSVSLWGSGESSAIVGYISTTGDGFEFESSGSSAPPRIVIGLHLAASQTSGSVMSVESGCRMLMIGCSVAHAGSLGRCLTIDASSTTNLAIQNTRFSVGTGSAQDMVHSVSDAVVRMTACDFVAPATYNPPNGLFYGNSMNLADCRFDLSATTSGTASCVTFNSTTVIGTLRGCSFIAGTGTFTAMTLGSYLAASRFFESDSVFLGTLTAYSYTTAANMEATGSVVLRTRELREFRYDHSGAPADLPLQQYGIISIVSTRAADTNYALDGIPPVGSRSVVLIRNEDGSPRTFSIVSTILSTSGNKSISNGSSNAWLAVLMSQRISSTAAIVYSSFWSA